jgi:hypothetical protein
MEMGMTDEYAIEREDEREYMKTKLAPFIKYLIISYQSTYTWLDYRLLVMMINNRSQESDRAAAVIAAKKGVLSFTHDIRYTLSL